MDLVNSKEDLDFLERCFASPGFQFVLLLYGRRRVG
jgi:hypothetical protein